MINISNSILIKWLIYAGIVVNSAKMFFDIRDSYTIRILGSVLCPTFGSNWRCGILSKLGIFGVFSGFIMIVLEINAKSKKNNMINRNYKIESILCLFHSFFFSFFLFISTFWMVKVHSSNLLSRIPAYLFVNMFLFFVTSIFSTLDKSTSDINN